MGLRRYCHDRVFSDRPCRSVLRRRSRITQILHGETLEIGRLSASSRYDFRVANHQSIYLLAGPAPELA